VKTPYNAEANALYIRFVEATVTTQHVAEGVAVDYAEDGRIAGIEILDARQRLGDGDLFQRVVLENLALAEPTA
jgi:uncharacterized protein YuzE